MNRYFFDLPVYRLSRELYQKWIEENELRPFTDRWTSITGHPPPKDSQLFCEDRIYQKYGPWDFNEIIGYIRLYLLGSQIRGEYFSAEKQRNPISRKKVFTFRSLKLASEQEIWPESRTSNKEIWLEIQKYILRCERELTKGRVIDSSRLETLGPHLDWVALFGWDQREPGN